MDRQLTIPDHISVIETKEELLAFCAHVRNAPYIVFDTEFTREDTYAAELNLLQVATPEAATLIDPMSGLDLAPVHELLVDTVCPKIVHSGRQDLEILYRLWKQLPTPLFDTQIAVQALGYGSSIGFDRVVLEFLEVTVDKSSQVDNWRRRPLSHAQKAYALGDVVYLIPLYEAILKALEEKGRLHWVLEDMQKETDINLYTNDPNEAWKRMTPRDPTPQLMGVLRVLATWREEQAQLRDLPRRWILKDGDIITIASKCPKTLEELKPLVIEPRHLRPQDFQEILELIKQGLTSPFESPSLRSKVSSVKIKQLKHLITMQAEALGIISSFLATTDDCVEFLADIPNARLKRGWRWEVLQSVLRNS